MVEALLDSVDAAFSLPKDPELIMRVVAGAEIIAPARIFEP